MTPKLSLDLSVVLRRHFVMSEDVEQEVIAELLEEVKKRDEYVVRNSATLFKSSGISQLEFSIKINAIVQKSIIEAQEETL